MAKGQNLSRHQQAIVNRYYEHRDTIMTQKLGEIVSNLYLCEDKKKAAGLWKRAYDALKKTDANPNRAANIVARRSIEELAALVGELTMGDQAAATPHPRSVAPAKPAAQPAGATDPDQPPSPETLKAAMKAFRKRLKLTRLDHESQINNRTPLTSGKSSGVVSIIPPNQYPRTVWDELVRQGKLKRSGGGFHELA